MPDTQWLRTCRQLLKEAGATHVRTSGGHEIWRVPGRGQVVVPHHPKTSNASMQRRIVNNVRKLCSSRDRATS